MTNNSFTQQSGLSVDAEFLDFVNTSVIPATSMDAAGFWDSFASLLNTATSVNSTCAATPAHNSADTTIPVRVCSKPLNTSWGSLYDALYHESAIPHSTGLKPGNSINMARYERVVRCAKDFLDKTFPLSEGSHRDAVSYMAYFQNLLVILADGTTTGLQSPKQFVARNGPSDSPDSILLEHNGTHTEILFDCNGNNGSRDLASIDDVQLQTTQQAMFDFEAGTASEKCNAYKNWFAIAACHHDRVFSDCSGEQIIIKNCNRAITTSGTSNQCTLVIDQRGTPVPDAIVDASMAAIIQAVFCNNSALVNLYFAADDIKSYDTFFTELEQLLHSMNPNPDAADTKMTVKVFSDFADTHTNSAIRQNSTGSGSEYISSPAAATIDTMHSHGYDLTQVRSL